MPIAVSDSSVLIHLGAVEQLDLLPAFYDPVVIPQEVWREVVIQGRSTAVVQAVQNAAKQGWLEVQGARHSQLIQHMRQNLHPGEAAAICLALETQATTLLMDETDGRTVARQFGIHTIGVVGLLIKARKAGRLSELRPWLSRLVQSGFYLQPAFAERILRQVGEYPGETPR